MMNLVNCNTFKFSERVKYFLSTVILKKKISKTINFLMPVNGYEYFENVSIYIKWSYEHSVEISSKIKINFLKKFQMKMKIHKK